MFKPTYLTLAAVLLAGCGGNASSSGAAKANVATTSTAAKTGASAPAAKPAIPSAPLVGQRAPGPYAPDGVVTVSGGQAALDATDTLKWQPNTIIAKAGEKVTLQIRNAGSTVHTFIAPSLGAADQDIGTGKTSTVSFTAPSAPGAYQYWCNVPGHSEAGMVGQIIVQQ